MNRFLFVCMTSVCVGLASCAASTFEPQWLTDARAREAEPMSARTIRSGDGFFKTKVPAELRTPVAKTEDAYHVQLDVGSEAAVECFVYREALDPAASLSLISSGTFEAIASHSGKIAYKKIEQVDAGAIGGSPYLSIDWLYRIGNGANFQVGAVKHLTAQKDGRTVHCLHHEVGYAKTFRRAVRGLVESLEYGKPLGPRPLFTQISTLSIKGMNVGVEHATVTRDGSDRRVDVRTSLVVPVNRDTVQTTDTFSVEFVEPDGDLINQVHVETTNGEVVTHLKLDPLPDGLWKVSGTYQTKPISAEVRPGSHPSSWLGEALTLRRALANRGIGSEITLVRWIPGADPTTLVDETLSIERKLTRDRYGAKLTVAGLEADLVVDDKGSVAEGSVELGMASIGIERVYMGGKF